MRFLLSSGVTSASNSLLVALDSTTRAHSQISPIAALFITPTGTATQQALRTSAER
jgi:hypothetical protein